MECLVTKLKGTVDDSSLMKLGEIQSEKTTADSWDKDSQTIKITSSRSDITLKIIGDGYFTDENNSANNGKEITIEKDDEREIYLSNGTYVISIISKYYINFFDLNTGSKGLYNNTKCLVGGLESLIYSKSISRIRCNGCTISGDISSLKNITNIVEIYLGDSKGDIFGDINNFSNLSKLRVIMLSNNHNVEGNISVFNEFTSLTTLNLRNCNNVYGVIDGIKAPLESLNLSFTGASGSIEAFVASQRSAGRTTGNISANLYNSSVTFDGDESLFNTDTSVTISWTATQITCADKTITA